MFMLSCNETYLAAAILFAFSPIEHSVSANMASGIRERLHVVTECSICKETFTDPRILPCVHTYCMKCIEGFCRDKLPGDEVACPLCRIQFKIPNNGVDGLPKNFFVEQLKEMADTSKTYCEGCTTDETEPGMKKTATMFCEDCRGKLCATCADSHRRVKLTQTHKLIAIDGNDVIENVAKMAREYCEKHSHDLIRFYCFQCKSTICMACYVESHHSHECSDVNKVVDEFRKQMTVDIQNLTATISTCREVVRKQRKRQSEFSGKIGQIEQEICDRVENLKEQIEQEKASLLKELASFKEDRMKEINIVTDDVEQHVSFAESLVKYTEELQKKGAASDIAQQFNSLRNRTSELLKLDVIHQTVNGLGSLDVTFATPTWQTLSKDNIVGKIHHQRSDGEPFKLS
jgi:hypothetical protein